MDEKNSIIQRVESIAEKAAQEIPVTGRAKLRKNVAELNRDLQYIRKAYKRLVYSKGPITPDYEWLYDNFYILEREGRQLIKALPKLGSLPQSGEDTVAYLHAVRLCGAASGSIDAASIEHYVIAAQRYYSFESGELEAFGLMIRAALIKGAAQACSEDTSAEVRERLLSDAVKTLNFLTTFDFSEIIERQSLIEQILSEDPAGIYPKMDERTRTMYRKYLSGIAQKKGVPEEQAAREAINAARLGNSPRSRHVGSYIVEHELVRRKPRKRGAVYISLLLLIPVILSIAAGILFKRVWLPFLVFLPFWEVSRTAIDYFILKGIPATFLPRMETDSSIPDSEPTLVVVSTLLSSAQKSSDFAKKLEQFYYSNGRGNVRFGILADLKAASLPVLPEDKAVRAAAVKAVQKLNAKYGDHFYLFLRSRRYSRTQGGFSGWERKRGAIIELVRMLKGRQTSISTIEGDRQWLDAVKYIITLDADTGLIMDTAAEMVSVAMHPLNSPEMEDGCVKKGFGILSPRIGVDLQSAGVTPFSRIMAGCGGVTAYDNAAGNTYQDLFGEGIYAGKGLICTDAFYSVLDSALPENRVLSHDILEGCFMRAAFLSDVELTDGFPPRPAPWFDRLHRWIRGDWQNIQYIFLPRSDPRSAAFNGLSRFKLFDNLRRSLSSVASLLCLIAAAFTAAPVSALLITLSVLCMSFAGIWNAAIAVIHGGPSMLSRKYHCRVLPQAVNSLAQGILAFLFMPYRAVISIDAIVRSLWRRHSKKKLLEWVTAAESEAHGSGFMSSMRRFGPVLFCGVLFLAFALQPGAKIVGAFFIITPFIAWLSGRKSQPVSDDLSDEDRDALESYAAAMWRYYEDYAGEEDHYLPPDNIQEAPVHVVAHRTSPTNIGLLLLSTLAARDLGLIDTESLFDRVEKTVSTIEQLEQWKGHLYNWYDTRTLAPLRPAYVSTVDSGNLLCCLVALRQGLSEYKGDFASFPSLDARIEKILNGTDLSALYNRHRRLFHIGYDVENKKLSGIYYDLLMSESRMTSYYAIAKRIVPKRHWGTLGRTLTRQGGYTGPVSWTGTMFEYLMPHMLLPVYEDSMAAEALRFVIFCQKRRVKELGIPWGISESGFYSFDAALNYQYEAHGVQKLALKRGMDNDLVISPYSTFLALPFDRASSMKNLKRLADTGMYGRCGFFEAADYTFKRTGGHMALVKSYMAHHVGMSIVSAANALLDGIMQERFMRDKEMRAARDLLSEKIPADAVVFNDVLRREIPEKPGRNQFTREEFVETSPITPRVNAVSNGEYTLILTDSGASVSMFRGIDITRRSSDLLKDPTGVYAVCDFGKEKLCATAAPGYASSRLLRRKVEFNTYGAAYHTRDGSYGIDMVACLHGGMPCEARFVEISNYTQRKVDAKLLLYFEPVLAKAADEAAHPAFSRLFLSAEYRPDTKMLLFARRARGNELPAFLAVGFAEHEADFEFDANRSRLLKRPDGISSLEHALNTGFDNRTGAIPEAAAALKLQTELPARGKKGFTLLFAAANTREEAAARLIEARRQGFHGVLRAAAGKDSGEMESRLAALILPQILFPASDGRKTTDAAATNRLGQPGLWSLGISGDYPIILFELNDEHDGERLEPYIKTHKSLRLKGIQADLAVVFREGGDYSRHKYGVIKETARLLGCDYLIGARGGIHLVNLSQHPPEIYGLLVASACHIAARTVQKPQFTAYSAARFLPVRALAPGTTGLKTFAGTFDGSCFEISHSGETPDVPWCHILTNPVFGTLLSDCSLGFTWAVNARENKLTPWSNDVVADNHGEIVAIKVGRRIYDLCKGARVTFSPEYALYEGEADSLKYTLRVSVPPHAAVKIIELDIENTGEKELEFENTYYTEPVLGVNGSTKRHVSISGDSNSVFIRNAWAQVSGYAFITSPDGIGKLLTNRGAFFSGHWNSDLPPAPDPCAAVVKKLRLPPRRREKTTFILGWAASENAAHILAQKQWTPDNGQHAMSGGGILMETPDNALNAVMNTWLRWQFMSSRIMGRTGFYQCGGAWGFRDQLQDCCAALLFNPEITKAHIYRSAAHQFKEGDVMHWWHQLPPRDGGSKGVRTRCSDDMLWLPYTVCEYIEKTGDYGLFDRSVYYLEGPELDGNEEDRYFIPHRSDESENVYRHCIRAIDRAMKTGQHGITLFGSGDWNDGMNLVGIGGRGESVWLAMFLALVLDRFAPICDKMGDSDLSRRYSAEAQRLRQAIDNNCWDGDRYARGFYDDGGVFGVKSSDECKIDILPQSFSAIAGMPDGERRRIALDSVMKILVDDRLKIVHLFDPPFDGGNRNPGYIRSYPPGIRENGGQYTHGAVWGALAMLIENRPDDAMKILAYLNPVTHSLNAESARIYRLEPYAVAADIYSNGACEGRGGWSMYTGAAGWYFRTVFEYLLGIKILGDKVKLKPCLPSDWDGYRAQLILRNTFIDLSVKKGTTSGLLIDGENHDFIPLDRAAHRVELTIPAEA